MGCSPQSAPAQSKSSRIYAFDALRGFTIISMVLFHAAYDAVYLFGFHVDWFCDPVIQNIWRCSISWTFIALAGWMTRFSRNNFKRAAVYGACAALVWVATSLAQADIPISFGILYCMAACTLCYAALSPVLARVHPGAILALSLCLFALTYALPYQTYEFEGLAWLGFPSARFMSGDYYPLIPYVFLYVAGASGARLFDRLVPQGYPSWMRVNHLPILSALGRHSLVIYLAHQPLLLAAFTLATAL